MMTEIDRRRLLTVAGGMAIARPPALLAQAGTGLRRVAVMLLTAEGDPEGELRLRAFRLGLQQLGWIEGRNLVIDTRWGVGEPERARNFAAELIALAPDVIVANGTTALAALKQATRTTPIVFAVVTDPVGAGFVESLARPGGNITGFSTFEPEIGGKWLELLAEVAPGLKRVAGISDPTFSAFDAIWRTIEGLAPGLGIGTTPIVLRHQADDLEAAIAAFAKEPAGGLIVLPTSINNVSRQRIFALAARHRLPAVYPFRLYATSGGLMSYGFDPVDLLRRSASYVDRILRGEPPANLPVQAPTKFELIVNLKTAKVLGLTLPLAIQLRADEVIE